MRKAEESLKQMMYILFKSHPELKKDFNHNMTIENGRKYGMSNSEFRDYEKHILTITFPRKYRDEVFTISKFCGINFAHEYYDEETITFKSDDTNFN
jgi:hypothetical protein